MQRYKMQKCFVNEIDFNTRMLSDEILQLDIEKKHIPYVIC
jgi:hypothetical protein